jgi:hypothetical protein
MQARQRSRAIQRRQQRNRPRLCPLNHRSNHILVTGGHADRTLLIQKIFSANSAGVARRGDQRATIKQPANPKMQKHLGQGPRPTRVAHSCNARSSRTTLEKRSRVRFRLSLAASLRRAASLTPFRRPPAAFRRQRQTEAGANIMNQPSDNRQTKPGNRQIHRPRGLA